MIEETIAALTQATQNNKKRIVQIYN